MYTVDNVAKHIMTNKSLTIVMNIELPFVKKYLELNVL